VGAAGRAVIAAVVRFVAVSLAAYALANAFPAALLAGPAWLACLLVPGLGPPALSGAVITYGQGIRLEDPYVLAGIPLFLGLWAAPARRVWGRAILGIVVMEVFAGITVALVALTILRGWIETPAREPLELVALAFVAAIRILPVPLWLALDPSWKAVTRARRSSAR